MISDVPLTCAEAISSSFLWASLALLQTPTVASSALRPCRQHPDCAADQYCFSWKRCREFQQRLDCSVGDVVDVLHAAFEGLVSGYARGVVRKCNGDGTSDVEDLDHRWRARAVLKTALVPADGIVPHCGPATTEGYCGPLQSCGDFQTSVDGRCPGASENKRWPLCEDLAVDECARRQLRQNNTACSSTVRGMKLSVLCCASCSNTTQRPAEQDRNLTPSQIDGTSPELVAEAEPRASSTDNGTVAVAAGTSGWRSSDVQQHWLELLPIALMVIVGLFVMIRTVSSAMYILCYVILYGGATGTSSARDAAWLRSPQMHASLELRRTDEAAEQEEACQYADLTTPR
eukprot:TRINITY_DN28720_c0_g1_i1.p1 TRINITY_DN28720_c0_g1~~TRINITY_DN28720_c0_g1_i1.p1  ORF type:complete len:346 (-),score=26.57 TRINITY_DN28720_c0_g1_i1:9-1046(-)